jgi:hypothetical protein
MLRGHLESDTLEEMGHAILCTRLRARAGWEERKLEMLLVGWGTLSAEKKARWH